MTSRSRAELNRIVRAEMPGYHVVPNPRAAIPGLGADAAGRGEDGPDAGTPDLDTLRRKYLQNPGEHGATAADTFVEGAADADGGETGDDQIVAVAPDDHADPWDRAVRPKSLVIDPDGKVIGAQG